MNSGLVEVLAKKQALNLLLVMAILGGIESVSAHNASADREDALAWLKENVNASCFDERMANAEEFYLSESEEASAKILNAEGYRYILIDHGMIYGESSALASWADENLRSYIKIEDNGTQATFIPGQKLFNTTLGKLYFLDGAGTTHFRLIYESKTFLGENPRNSEVKIFEYVPGALIRVRTGADQTVGAMLNMTSNQDRHFIYTSQAEPTDGSFEIRVPYSTENRYNCRAIDPYLIFSGNHLGIQMRHLNVSEGDVLYGRTIQLAF
jgi:dolichyl-phosphooligosaccharide-protein glycotransferase